MSTTKSNKLFHKLTLLSAMVILTFSVSGGLLAQEETPTVEPTSVPTEIPTEASPTTEPPTLEPTVEPTSAPTEIPTEVPPPTTEPPTAEPTQEATAALTEVPTETPTETPTLASAPPVFNFTNGGVFESVAGTSLTFQISVSDETGMVSVTADTTASIASVSLVTTAPVETAPPFNTLVDVTYLAPVDFSGADTFTLTAIDAASVVTSAAITVNVALPTPEVTETVVPTDIPVPTRELIINYSPTASEESIQAMLAALSAVEISRIPQIGAMQVLVPETVSQPAVAMSTLQSSRTAYAAGVTNIEPNGTYQLLFTPNDPQFGSQWGLGGGDGGIFASLAWDVSTRRGTGITVAVLDSGVDFQHPDLANQLLTTGWDFVNDDSNADDDNGHGTQVAGIIAARTNNLVGIAGIAYLAKIMPVKVCNAAEACELYHIAGGIIHAVDRGARIINLSLGSTAPSSTMEAAIHYALSRNVVVIAAAGNTGTTGNDPIYPAFYPGVISIGMHDSLGDIDPMSTNNNQVDFSAPGVGIRSTVPVELDTDGTADGYTTDTGTSFAAPHVSGIAALLMSASVATTPATVMDALMCGAEDETDPPGAPGYDNYYGHGRVKADFAMTWHSNSSSCTVTLPNDNFEAASVITVAPYRATQAVHSRSVTEQASDPLICGSTREQTLWYRYRPTVAGFYQVSTLGSSYNTVFGVFQGSAGALSQVGCSTALQAAFGLEAYVTYYIAVGTNGAAVDDQVLELRVNPAISRNNLDYQENSTSIAYTGSWARGVVSGASGSYTQQTNDQQAMASFSFRGISFDYVRTIGPSQGQVRIYVNGVELTALLNYDTLRSNRAAVTRSNQVVNFSIPNAVPGQWNVVRIMRDPSVAGMIDIDRIRTYDFDTTALAGTVISRVDDRHAYLRYIDPNMDDSWDNVGPPSPITGTYLGTLKETIDDTDYMVFRGRGNAIIIYRATGTNYADMEVVIDNGTPVLLANVAGTPTIRTFTIDGLNNTEHVVEIRKQEGDPGQIQLDSVQASVLGTLAAGVTYQERVAQLAYRGTWTDTTTTTRTLDANSEVSFKFSGNDLCIGYQRPNSDLQIYFDGTLFHTLPASGLTGPATWCVDATNGQLLADITHYTRLVPSGGTFTLDYFKPQRYSTLTPARGIVQETDVSFRYSAVSAWIRTTTAVGSAIGGYKPQGGYLRYTSTDITTITFYINGTGFILYTAVGPLRGCWEMTVDGVAQPFIDLNDVRDSPLGYGITGLNPGIHRIVLVADTNLSSGCGPVGGPFIVDFDAVRVFP